MNSSELIKKVSSVGLYPIRVWMTERRGESSDFQFIGTLEEFLAAAKAMAANVIFFSVSEMEEDDFVYEADNDDSEENNRHSDDTPEPQADVDLMAALPSLAGFKKYIGEENQLLLTVRSPQGTLELFLTEKWWDEFCEQRQKAIEKVDEDHEAIYEKMDEERERKEENLFKQLRALVDDDDVCRITTQRAMRAYALDKIPALGEVDEDRLVEEIQNLSDKVKLRKRK